MKPYILCLIFACTAISACQSGPTKDVPAGQLSAGMIHNPRSAEGLDSGSLKSLPFLVFDDTTYNFGWMGEGEKVSHEFSFRNTGKSPLIVAGATSSCGCTVPQFSKDPIAAGGTGIVKVTFSSAGKQGHILKTITVSSNAYPPVRILTITADIKPQTN